MATTQFYLKEPLTEAAAIELLLEQDRLTPQDIKDLQLYLSASEPMPADLWSKYNLVLFAQVQPKSQFLH